MHTLLTIIGKGSILFLIIFAIWAVWVIAQNKDKDDQGSGEE